jgi:hypothetical protein
MYKLINLLLSAAQWLSATACLVATALYADGKMPFRYAWSFGMIFFITLALQIITEKRGEK